MKLTNENIFFGILWIKVGEAEILEKYFYQFKENIVGMARSVCFILSNSKVESSS